MVTTALRKLSRENNIDDQFDPIAQQDNGEKLIRCEKSDGQPSRYSETFAPRHPMRKPRSSAFVGNVGDLEKNKREHVNLVHKTVEDVMKFHTILTYLHVRLILAD